MKTYIQTPELSIAEVGKGGSSAIGKAAILTFYPERQRIVVGYDMSNQPMGWGRESLERTETPDGVVLVPVREPIERFRSACAQTRIENVDDLLTKIETQALVSGGRPDRKITWDKHFHFRPTVDYTTDLTVKLYKFPEQIDDLAAEAGLPVPLPSVNDSASNNPPKPVLTPEQLARVEVIYADDIALYNSITTAGQEFVGEVTPPEPTTDEAKAAKILELEAARYQAEIAGTIVAALGGAFVRTDKETQNELGKALALLTIDPTFEIDWKFPDGTIVHLAKAQIEAVAQEVFSHVQQTRTDYKVKAEAVAVATTQEELESITWL